MQDVWGVRGEVAEAWVVGAAKEPCEEMPVLPGTMLGLALLRQEPSIDLRLASELVLSDVGATVHVLRLIGREYAADRRMSRMEECLAALDAKACFRELGMHVIPSERKHRRTLGLWKHCRVVAQYARLVAESLPGMVADEAYLVGLLHEVEQIPDMLGWSTRGRASHATSLMDWLPLFVEEALVSVEQPGANVWKFVLAEAHTLADGDER